MRRRLLHLPDGAAGGAPADMVRTVMLLLLAGVLPAWLAVALLAFELRGHEALPLLAGVGVLEIAAAATAAWLARRLLVASDGLAREARHDPLTRLVNRKAFHQRLDEHIRERGRRGGALTLLFIDLDDFKSVNDRWGHAAGDALLCACASRLLKAVREDDLSARLSGDEFAVLIDGLAAHEAEPIARTLLERLSQPYRVGLCDVRISASIGLAAFPHDGTDAATLLDAADAAMYAAKAAGKGEFRRSNWGDLASPGPWFAPKGLT